MPRVEFENWVNIDKVIGLTATRTLSMTEVSMEVTDQSTLIKISQ